MNDDQILAALHQRRVHLNEAIRHLEAVVSPTKLGRPAGKGRRHMSADARARISKAMKSRWAARKKDSIKVHILPRRKAA